MKTLNGLHSNNRIGNVIDIKENPSVRTERFLETPDWGEPESRTLTNPTISSSPDLYNRNGEFMSDEGFIKLPRSLLTDPIWKGMRDKYRKVFITLLIHTSYKKNSFGIGSNRIKIEPGQFCTSIRNLVDLCNDGVRFKEDLVDKNIVERSVSLFTRVGLVRQEVRHQKSILTITQPELYKHFQIQCETQSETEPRHNRDTNEERKEVRSKSTFIKEAFNVVESPLSKNEEKQKQEISEQESDETQIICEEFCKNYQITIESKDIKRWSRMYNGDVIISTFILLKNAKKKINNPAAWMENALKQDWVKTKNNIPINKEFSEKFQKEKKWYSLIIREQYCTLPEAGIDLNFKMDPNTFKESLECKYENVCRPHNGLENY
jgi:hypothetical protein